MLFSRIFTLFLSIIFLLYLVFPSLFPFIKLLLLVLAVAIMFLLSGFKKSIFLPFNKSLSLYLILLLPFFITSILNNNPGGLPLALSNLILPLVYYILLSFLTGILSINLIINLVSCSAPLILLTQIIGYQNSSISSFLQARSGTIYQSTSILASNFTYSGTKSLYFVVPFISACLIYLFLYPHKIRPTISSRFLSFCLAAGLISLLLSFEGTSFAIFAISTVPFIIPILKILFNLLLSLKIRFSHVLFLVISFITGSIILYFLYEYFYSLLFDRLFSKDLTDSGDITRAILYQQHLKSFAQSPILGNGIGFDNGLGRSDAPWSSELTYANALSQYGLLGIFIYINYIGFFFIKAIKYLILHATHLFDYYEPIFLLPYVYGVSSSLIAAINNPSLGSAENLFIFLIPVLAFNQLFYFHRTL